MSAVPAVFLDRDGVLCEAPLTNGRPHPPDSLEQLRVVPGAERACSALKAAGLTLICITNQPDIARRTASVAEVEAINLHLQRLLGLEAVAVCPHDDADGCECRKPKPGLILDVARRFRLDLERSVVVGDRWRDIEAGLRAGCRTVFIDHGYVERRPAGFHHLATSLDDAVPWIIASALRTTADQADVT